MIIVGFDWARDKHDVCVQDPAGETLCNGIVKHNAEAFERLRLKLAELEPNPAAVLAFPTARRYFHTHGVCPFVRRS